MTGALPPTPTQIPIYVSSIICVGLRLLCSHNVSTPGSWIFCEIPVLPTTDNLSWEAQVFHKESTFQALSCVYSCGWQGASDTGRGKCSAYNSHANIESPPQAAREGPLYKFLDANRTFAEMEKRRVVWLALFLLFNAAESERVFRNNETDQRSQYTASWAVEITEGGEKMAERIALKYGFINAGKVRRDLTCKRYSHIVCCKECMSRAE